MEELQGLLEKQLYEVFHNGINLEYHAKQVPAVVRLIYLKNPSKAFDFLLEYISEFIKEWDRKVKLLKFSEFPEGCFLNFSFSSRILTPEEGERLLKYYKNWGENLKKQIEKMKRKKDYDLNKLENSWAYVLFFQARPQI